MKRHIAILITNFEGGGAQRVALTQARELQNRGYRITLLALEHQEDYTIPSDIDFRVLSDAQGTDGKLKKARHFLFLPYKLARILCKEHIDLCISHLERADFVNVLAKTFGSHESVGVIHSHLTANYALEGHTLRSRLYLWLVKRLEPHQSRVVAVSEEIRLNLRSLGIPEHKTSVICNPFPIEDIRAQAREKLGALSPAFAGTTLLSIGRLSRQKGFWHILKTLPDLKKHVPNLSYVIIGDGPLRDFHIETARQLGLSVFNVWEEGSEEIPAGRDVYFLGFTDTPFRCISNSETLVLPSHYEGLPNVLVESLICGTPVIATDVQAGPRELLAPQSDPEFKTQTLDIAEYGILTPRLNPNYETDYPHTLSEAETMLQDGLTRLLTDEGLRDTYTKKAPERVRDFAQDAVMEEWENLIRDVDGSWY